MSAPCPIFGFIVRASSLDAARRLRAELAERLSENGLLVDAARDRASLVVTREGSQATDSDRHLVIDLLEGELNAGDATVSDLVDLATETAF
jgi:hypothetical protein